MTNMAQQIAPVIAGSEDRATAIVAALKGTPEGDRLLREIFKSPTEISATDIENIELLNTFPFTDAGNAEAFVALYEYDMRFDHRSGHWLSYHEHRWKVDDDGAVIRRALAAIRSRLQAATLIDDDDRRKEAVKWALSSESRIRIEAMLAIVKALYPVSDSGKQWDSDGWLLGVGNGVLDLRTGKLRDGHPDDRITKQTPSRW